MALRCYSRTRILFLNIARFIIHALCFLEEPISGHGFGINGFTHFKIVSEVITKLIFIANRYQNHFEWPFHQIQSFIKDPSAVCSESKSY